MASATTAIGSVEVAETASGGVRSIYIDFRRAPLRGLPPGACGLHGLLARLRGGRVDYIGSWLRWLAPLRRSARLVQGPPRMVRRRTSDPELALREDVLRDLLTVITGSVDYKKTVSLRTFAGRQGPGHDCRSPQGVRLQGAVGRGSRASALLPPRSR